MKIFGQLKQAMLEVIPGAVAQKVAGLIYFRSDTKKPLVDDGDAVREIMVRHLLAGTEPILPNEGGTGKQITDLAGKAGLALVINPAETGYAFDEAGGGVEIKKTQAAHGFVLLDPIYHNGTIWTKAQADSADTMAEYVVTEIVDANTFIASKFGEIEIIGHGLTPGEHYFLSETVAGDFEIFEGTEYSGPLFYVEDANTIQLEVYRPSETGAGDAGELQIEKTQVAHGFLQFDAIYHDGAQWQLAQADDGNTLAEFVVTDIISNDVFRAAKWGEIVQAGHGYTVGNHYYLSDLTAGGAVTVEPASYSAPLFYVEDINTIQIEVYRPAVTGTVGQISLYDQFVSSLHMPSVNDAIAAAVDGDSIMQFPETLPVVSVAQTISKRVAIFGKGNGSVINGNVTFPAGSNGSSLKNLRVNGSITIDAGVKNLILTDIWLTTGNVINDNSGNSSNLILAVIEE